MQETLEFIKNKKGVPFFFAGMDYKATEDWLIENDCLRLLSFVNDKRAIEKRCERNAKTFVDSGAFSAMNRGIQIDVEDYINWLNEWDENLTMYCCWDSIPSTEDKAEECAKKTWDNYLYMKSKLKNPDKLVYCYHYLEDIKWLEQAINSGVKLIALGGLAKRGKNMRNDFLQQVKKVVQGQNDLFIHAFGMTTAETLEKFKFINSADSATWLYTSKFGEIETFSCKRVYFGDNLEKKNHYMNLDLMLQMDLDIELDECGFTPEMLTERRNRSMYQAHYWKTKMEMLKR